MRAIASSTGRSTMFQGRASLIEPVTPPSELAPLSESTNTSVLSSSPSSSRKSSSAPDLVVGVLR